jgi:hypothetical protein
MQRISPSRSSGQTSRTRFFSLIDWKADAATLLDAADHRDVGNNEFPATSTGGANPI